jgi:hypothetical protein
MNDLPPRTSATMSDAIAMSSPSGRMSKRARKAAGYIPEKPPQEDPVDSRLRRARDFRYMAARGMQVRTFSREAARLEAEAAALIAAGHVSQVR